MNQPESMTLAPFFNVMKAEYSFNWKDEFIDGIFVAPFSSLEEPHVLRKGYILESSPYFITLMKECEEQFLQPFLALYGKSGTFWVNSIINNFIIRLDKEKAHVRVNLMGSSTTKFFVRNEPIIGELAKEADLTSAYKVILEGEEFAPETGVLIFYSLGWGRLLYMDFTPVLEPGATLDELPKHLAMAVNDAFFPKPTESMLERLFSHNWFPFSIIPQGQWVHFMGRLESGEGWAVIKEEIIAIMTPQKMGQMVADWKRNKRFKAFISFISDALRSYNKRDYAASIYLIWPRIEGLMGSLCNSRKAGEIVSHMDEEVLYPLKHMAGFSPKVFRDYLEKQYFREFNLGSGDVQISRHSLAHAAVDYEQMTQENALLGFLILDQLHHLLWALDVERQDEEIGFKHLA